MELLKWLAISDRYSRMYLDKKLTKLQLNSGQYFYVLRICEEPGITQDRLISLVHVNPSNVTRAIAYLEKSGFLEKKQNMEDRRTFHLYPTQKAKSVYMEIKGIREKWEADFLQVLNLEERKHLEELLKRLGMHAIAFRKEERMNEYGK